ncbi:hypothetical protein [Candidatus Methylomirabilis sp.]|uniref:hypothetical protein n=1 Tax=Candidatus Methylomirabilis sp. TaxID=2032687 RepID=UPI003C796CD4
MTGRVTALICVVLGLVLTTGCRSRSELRLKAVNVRASAIYCLFDPSCAVTFTNSSTIPIPISSGGTSFLHARSFAGKSGTPGSGLYGYEYRIDLSKAVETMVDVEGIGKVSYMPCMQSIALEFGPIIDTLDYDGDGKAGDLAYVVTDGGPGKIGLDSFERYHNMLTFRFDSPICAGGHHSEGDSTYFFGLVSAQPSRFVTATIKETSGLSSASPKMKKNIRHKVQVRAPQIGTASEPDRPGSL